MQHSPLDNAARIPFSEALLIWIKVALLSFGGPAGQIAVMHRLVVEEKRWISEERFLHALNYCMLLPGPEAQQLAIYLGWLLHRALGGIVAGVLFVLPGFLAILALSVVYGLYQEMPLVEALFFGLKPAVLAIVLQAVLKIGKKALANGVMIGLAAASFVAMFVFDAPFPLVLLAAALTGLVGGRYAPALFRSKPHGNATNHAAADSVTDAAMADITTGWKRNATVIALCLTLWFAPIALLAATMGTANVLMQEAVFFSKITVMTFGGAYAVLAYVAQQAVERYGWLQPGEMLDGLGMAETTPGPLIQVVQFVAFMGAYRFAEGIDPLWAGILASVLVTWVTFVPCFLWIFLGAPYIEKLRGNQHLSHALSAITAAVVGVIVNLAAWFSLHTLFGELRAFDRYGLSLEIPVWATMQHESVALAALAIAAMFWLKLGVMKTLGLCVMLGGGYHLLMTA